MKPTFAFLLILSACVTPPDAGTGPISTVSNDWRDEVIYQVLTDRFANGDASNDYNVDLRDPAAYHGGDWRGIKDKLDYLGELGVTTIWISPVVKNVEKDAGFSSYHGYWTQDFTRPNPHFGDLASLREMVDAAHAHGMKVILDIVTNHVGQAFYYDVNRNGQPDDFLIGQGGVIGPLGQDAPTSDFVRISEYDPDFSLGGIQSWTSLGPSGEAPVQFVDAPSLNRVRPYPDVFAHEYAYNRKGRVTVWTHPEVCGCGPEGCPWDNTCRRQQELLGDFPGGLKDLATERADVRDALFEVFSRWIKVGDFDGFRIDTLKHVEPAFWEDFCPRIRAYAKSLGKDNFFMFGEAFDGDDRLLGAYTQGQGVDSVFYFSQYYTMFRGAFLGDGSRTCEIERLHCRRHGCAADPCGEGQLFDTSLYNGAGKSGGPAGEDGQPLSSRQLVVNFESNHDVGRFLFFMPRDWSDADKRQLLHLGLAYLLTTDGIPSLYYGVEQELAGGNDPANRETLWDATAYQRPVDVNGHPELAPRSYDSDGDGQDDTTWSPYDTGNPTFLQLKSLIALRKEHVALRRGGFRVRWSTRATPAEGPAADHGLFAFERATAEETLLVVMNLGAKAQSRAAAMTVGFAPGATLVDLRDPGATFPVTSTGCTPGPGEGCLDVSVPPRALRVLSLR